MRIKLIAAGAGLLGYGALLGWAITADHYERKMKSNQQLLGDIIARQTKEIDALNEHFLNPNGSEAIDEHLNLIEKMVNEGVVDPSEFSIGRTDEVNPEFEGEDMGLYGDDQPRVAEVEAEEEYDEKKTEEIRSRLQSQISEYFPDESSAEEFVEVASAHERRKEPPFVISQTDYAYDEEGADYDKITIKYYLRERVLLDDDEDVIEDIAGVVGWANLNRFGDMSDQSDVVFVRNRRLRTDFEVVRETEDPPPLHIKYGMPKNEFETRKAAGLIRMRPEEM